MGGRYCREGKPGVAGIVQQTEGAIGYIGSEYALTLKLPTAKLKTVPEGM